MITKVNMICTAALCLLFTANNSVEAQVPGYVPTDGLVGWWDFNGQLDDQNGSAMTFSLTGSTQLGLDKDENPQSALQLLGDGSAYTDNNGSIPQYSAMTLSYWIKLDGGTPIALALGASSGQSWGSFFQTTSVNGEVWIGYGAGCAGTSGEVTVPTAESYGGEWHHVVMAIDGTDQPYSVYLDGELLGVGNANTAGGCNASQLHLGVDIWSAPEYMIGFLDDLGVWDRVLTPEEVSELYQAATPGCVDPSACNYNADATEDDGSCEYVSNPVVDLTEGAWFWTLQDDCAGLAIPFQLGFNADQTINDLQVNYWDFWTLCDSTLLIISGVTNEQVHAQWNGEAFVYLYEDGDCLTVYEGQFGCTDSTACNYNDSANTDDNSCIYVEGICDTCSGETDGTGVVVDNDADDDGVCDEDEVVGCQDPDACNYDPLATDEGECYYTPVYSIEGSLFTSAFDLEFYTYTNSEGSTYAWTCAGCAIQTGNGTSSVGLVWGEEGINELCVQETDSTGCVGELICVDVAVTATNVEDIDGDHFTIYPNPASTSITISTDVALLNSPYRITDAQGKLIVEGALRNSSTVLNTDQLSNGQYTLTIISEETVITKPLIIQK